MCHCMLLYPGGTLDRERASSPDRGRSVSLPWRSEAYWNGRKLIPVGAACRPYARTGGESAQWPRQCRSRLAFCGLGKDRRGDCRCRDVGPDIGLVKIEEHVGRKLDSDLFCFCGFACVDSRGKAQNGERKRSARRQTETRGWHWGIGRRRFAPRRFLRSGKREPTR